MTEIQKLELGVGVVYLTDCEFLDKIKFQKPNTSYIERAEMITNFVAEFNEKYKDFDWETLHDNEIVTEFPKCDDWLQCLDYYVTEKLKDL